MDVGIISQGVVPVLAVSSVTSSAVTVISHLYSSCHHLHWEVREVHG